MPGDATPPPELPPGLLAEYLESARSQLGVLAGLAHRIAARSTDREALDALRREIHKVHGSAGSYGFMDASRLAAGMEATVKEWGARPGGKDVRRASRASRASRARRSRCAACRQTGNAPRPAGRRSGSAGSDLCGGRRGARRAARVRVARTRVSVFGIP